MLNLPWMALVKAMACTFAQGAGFVIDIGRFAESFEQAGGMECRVRTAAFVVNEQKAEGAGPEFGRRHG